MKILTDDEIRSIAKQYNGNKSTVEFWFSRAVEAAIIEKIGEAVGKFEQEYMGGPVIWYQVEYTKEGTPLYAIPFIKEGE